MSRFTDTVNRVVRYRVKRDFSQPRVGYTSRGEQLRRRSQPRRLFHICVTDRSIFKSFSRRYTGFLCTTIGAGLWITSSCRSQQRPAAHGRTRHDLRKRRGVPTSMLRCRALTGRRNAIGTSHISNTSRPASWSAPLPGSCSRAARTIRCRSWSGRSGRGKVRPSQRSVMTTASSPMTSRST